MKSILVSSTPKSYRVEFGSFETGFPAALRNLRLAPSRTFIVTSEAVSRAGYPARLVRRLRQRGMDPVIAQIPNGETFKSHNTLFGLYKKGLMAGLDRRSLVIAMGGGVITDLAGFFAATYMRGIPYVSIPTTLLGMVDASIGGKTGIDLEEGKNLVGAFYPPRLVWIDQGFLKTLPFLEWKTGFAEIIKYGLIKSGPFFRWLEGRLRKNADIETWSQADIAKAIHESARIKAAVVAKDEKEIPLKGGREILNFGHTVGHALEAATVYGHLTHGEAIGIGMAAAGQIALDMKLWSVDEQLQMLFVLQILRLPIHCPNLTDKEKKLFWSALMKDKKSVSRQLRFVLPRKIGRVVVKNGIPLKLVQRAMQSVGL